MALLVFSLSCVRLHRLQKTWEQHHGNCEGLKLQLAALLAKKRALESVRDNEWLLYRSLLRRGVLSRPGSVNVESSVRELLRAQGLKPMSVVLESEGDLQAQRGGVRPLLLKIAVHLSSADPRRLLSFLSQIAVTSPLQAHQLKAYFSPNGKRAVLILTGSRYVHASPPENLSPYLSTTSSRG